MKHGPNGPKCNTHFHYLMTCADYDRLAERAGGRCEICRRAPEETGHGVLNIDHDASRGKGAVRGLLCSRCNVGLSINSIPADVRDQWLAAALFKEHPAVWADRRKRERRPCPTCGRNCAVRPTTDELYPHACRAPIQLDPTG